MTTRIFVSVGTDHHPFTRLLTWLDGWMDALGPEAPDVTLVMQHGATRPSRHAVNHEMLGAAELRAQYEAADIVISQVGPGTIADANRAGKLPIVVPRDPELGEVVDDHQVAFGDFMTARGRCRSVRTRVELCAEVEAQLLASPPGPDELAASAHSAATMTALSALTRDVLTAPPRRASARRLVTAVRRSP